MPKKHVPLYKKIQVVRGPKATEYALLHRKLPGDVGYDMTIVEDIVIPPGVDIPPTEANVDMCVKLPLHTFALITNRSGRYNHFPSLLLCPAPIDAGYTGPIGPRFQNLSTKPVLLPKGSKLVQLVLYSAVTPEVIEVTTLPKTKRAQNRFGSTNKKRGQAPK